MIQPYEFSWHWTKALSLLALRDPTAKAILDIQVKAAIAFIEIEQSGKRLAPELVRGILMGVFISGLDLGLSVPKS